RIVFGLALEDNFCLGAKALVIGQLDDLAHVDVALAEMQRVISANIRRKPVLAVNLLAIGHELGGKIFLHVLLLFRLHGLGHGFAAALHDLEIAIVNPYAALKITLPLDDGLGRDIEHIGVDFILMLLPN